MTMTNALETTISKRLGKRRLFYICRDLERAYVPNLDIKNYFIITNQNEYSKKVADKSSGIILLKNSKVLDTAEIMQTEQAKNLIQANDFVLVFKSNAIIENICKQNKWCLLNPSAKLADTVEGKISQVAWLGKLAKYLPPHKIDICKNIKWNNQKFILQFNHSHTGSGTFLISSQKQLAELKNKFPQREVRVLRFVDGPVFTNNNIVWGNRTMVGNISYQITGLSPFTDRKFATIGNDWALPTKILNTKQVKQYKKIVEDLGKKLNQDRWKGLFGVDIIMDKKTGKLYLLEINARQPASAIFESALQQSVALSFPPESGNPDTSQNAGSPIKSGMTKLTTTFQAHLASLLNIKPNKTELTKIKDGSQIIQRVTKKISQANCNLQDKSVLNIIKYKNSATGSDLVRIQLNCGVMAKHNVLNKLGQSIAKSLC